MLDLPISCMEMDKRGVKDRNQTFLIKKKMTYSRIIFKIRVFKKNWAKYDSILVKKN